MTTVVVRLGGLVCPALALPDLPAETSTDVSPTDLEARLLPNGIERLVLELQHEPANDAAEVTA